MDIELLDALAAKFADCGDAADCITKPEFKKLKEACIHCDANSAKSLVQDLERLYGYTWACIRISACAKWFDYGAAEFLLSIM